MEINLLVSQKIYSKLTVQLLGIYPKFHPITNPERLKYKEGLTVDTRIFLGSGNRIGFAGRLEAGKDENQEDQVRVWRENARRHDWNYGWRISWQ